MNIDPEAAAEAYRHEVLAPLRGSGARALELRGIEEQLSGQCTVEVAAFDAFSTLVADPRDDLGVRSGAVRHRADGAHVAVVEPAGGVE